MKRREISFCYRSLATLSLLLSTLSRAWAQSGGGYYRGHMWDGGWPGWLFGPMMMILFLALVVVAVVVVVRWLGDGGRTNDHKDRPEKSPVAILEERFARGEIDKDELEERRRVLEK